MRFRGSDELAVVVGEIEDVGVVIKDDDDGDDCADMALSNPMAVLGEALGMPTSLATAANLVAALRSMGTRE